MPQKITVNGQTYDDWSQVPPELQKALAGLPDADGNGVPDVFEGNLDGLVDPAQTNGRKTFTTTTSVEIDGQHYDSMDQVPQGLRDLIGQAIAGKSDAGDQPSPGASKLAASAAPDQVLLNGETVAVDQATGTTEKKGLLSRLFGR